MTSPDPRLGAHPVRSTRDVRARRLASRAYRRAARALAPVLPAGSEDHNVAAFDALQDEAFSARGWRGLCRVWLAESAAVLRLWRNGRRGNPSAREGAIMTSVRHDLRDAWRAIVRTPSYSAIVVATLALGIGVNTAIFSVVDTLLLKSLPYADADRLVRAAEWPKTGGNFTVAPAAFLHWREAASPFVQLEARAGRRDVLVGSGPPQAIPSAAVTTGYFDVLGVSAARGRTFSVGDAAPDAPCRAVISHRLWGEHFGGEASAVGRVVRLSNTPCTVIGVLPAGAVVDRVSAEVYIPLVFTPERSRDQGRNLTVLGRLGPDVTLAQARDRLAVVAASFNATRGPAGDGWSSAITPWRDVVVRADSRRLVLILFGAVGLVLAIACANVAGLALARATARRRELAIRAALGAGRWRVMRYLTLESVLLGALGGAVGVVVGSWTLEALASLMPAGVLPADTTIGLDGRALLFTAAAAIGTGVVFGILPAWQATRSVAAGSALVGDGRTQSASRGTSRLYAALVVAEMALAMVLVSGAVLLVTSFVRLGAVSPGFDPAPLLTFRLAHASGNPGGADATRLLERVTSALDALPGVAQSAAVTSLPLGGWLYGARFGIDGRPDDADRPTFAHIQRVTPGYFETLGLSMAEGRTFASSDDEEAPRRAIVNETFAARHLAGADRLGQRLRLGITTAGGGQNEIWEIVGVARDVKTGGLADAALATPEIYVPQAQSPISPAYLVARAAAGDAAALEPVIRRTLRELDPHLAIDDVRTMHERIGVSLRLERFRTTMISGFAVLASLLAGFGIYSVRARAVAARRREMGIRLALGATPAEVLRLVLRQGLTLAAAGVALGLAGAAYSAHLVEQWLFETAPTDPRMAAAAILLVGLPALAASWLPARRAASVSPTETLRGE